MTSSEMLEKVKSNLKLEDDARDLDISDVILSVCDYCNLSQEELPDLLEPIIPPILLRSSRVMAI